MTIQKTNDEFRPFGRTPSPDALVRHYSRPGFVVAVLPRSKDLRIPSPHVGVVVIAIGYRSGIFTLHPVAVFDCFGQLQEVPARRLKITDSGSPFLYEIQSIRPLKTRQEAIELAWDWVRQAVDGLPVNATVH